MYDKNAVKFDGANRNVELVTPVEKLFDKNGKGLGGTYKEAFSDKPETYDENGKKLDRINRKKESDIPGIEAYDMNKYKLEDKYAKPISSLHDDENL